MKQEGLIKHYGIQQKMKDSTRYDKEGNKINIEDLLKKIKTKLMLIEDNWFKITVVGEKVNAAKSLLVVSTEVNAN
ncbi:hypothetical protein Tco_1110359 [Tanacetum coccineum]|uniref:Uncharacterized protein n=1 Tax=Tanacetum coccineum TaxID=301880 RepID=A0ABQ5IJS5_9ASTR